MLFHNVLSNQRIWCSLEGMSCIGANFRCSIWRCHWNTMKVNTHWEESNDFMKTTTMKLVWNWSLPLLLNKFSRNLLLFTHFQYVYSIFVDNFEQFEHKSFFFYFMYWFCFNNKNIQWSLMGPCLLWKQNKSKMTNFNVNYYIFHVFGLFMYSACFNYENNHSNQFLMSHLLWKDNFFVPECCVVQKIWQ